MVGKLVVGQKSAFIFTPLLTDFPLKKISKYTFENEYFFLFWKI